MDFDKRYINIQHTDLAHPWRGSSRAPVMPPRRALFSKPALTRWPNLRTIVVPLDGTHFAEHALPYAIDLADRSGTTLKLVHVHLPYQGMDAIELLYSNSVQLQALKRRKEHYLIDVAKRISAVSSTRVEPYLVTSNDLTASLKIMTDSNTDFVVMAHHARGLMSRLWSGSVVHSLLPKLNAPVMLVRGHERPAQLVATRIEHILIPLNGTREAETVLEPSMMLGEIFQAEHTLMQVISLDADILIRHGTISTDWVPSKRREARARNYLERLASSLRSRSPDISTRVVSSDDAISEVITRGAKECNAELIAITPSTRGALSRMIRGSTQYQLVRNAHVPLLIVPRGQLTSGMP